MGFAPKPESARIPMAGPACHRRIKPDLLPDRLGPLDAGPRYEPKDR